MSAMTREILTVKGGTVDENVVQ